MKLKYFLLASLLVFSSKETYLMAQKTTTNSDNVLNVHDHTVIVQAMLLNMQRMKKDKINIDSIRQNMTVISKYLNPNLRSKLEIAKSINNQIAKMRRNNSAKDSKILTEVYTRMKEAKDINSLKNLFRKLSADTSYSRTPGLQNGIKLALAIIIDGEKTIYSPYFYRTIPGIKTTDIKILTSIAKSIGEADSEGAIGGAVSGCMVGALGGTLTFPGGGTLAGCFEVGAATGVGTGLGNSLAEAWIELTGI